MKVLNALPRNRRYRTPRGQWLAIHHQEVNKPWEKLHISRSTYFAKRKRQREAIIKKREAHGFTQIQLRNFLSKEEKNEGSPSPLSRTGMSLYYEREEGGGFALE